MDEDDGMDAAFAAYQAQEEYEFEQSALPPHKRDGYMERLFEQVDIERKRKMEAA